MAERTEITVRGTVQGVGFRPYVYRLAVSLGLKGYVANSPSGVTIEIEGEKSSEFIKRLPEECPPLSRIFEITVRSLSECGYPDFRIMTSKEEAACVPFTLVSPDVSTCDDCLRELMERSNRRYLYPFINCTNCGPRYTITTAVPYDRPHTTMAGFQMCRECSEEYADPTDRRFHAQPNACPVCGPWTTLSIGRQAPVRGPEAVEKTTELLRGGKIVGIKGIGGFHIACDATNEDTVGKLRERKRRSNKPFALMAPDIETIELFCEVSEEERGLLASNRRPIVLLRKRDRMIIPLPEAVSPRNRYLGFVLPYTPLHYLPFHPPSSQGFSALVMTSGNLSEEPIVRGDDEAEEKLSGIVDAVLHHNREIFMRVDDSVMRISSHSSGGPSGVSFVRRSRGYAPEPISLSTEGPEVMGCGADIKNTFTLTKGSFAIPSQHIGDMENYETLRFFEECLANMKHIYGATPTAIGHDLHPGYLSTQWALRQGKRTFGIQHHYAHIGSVMAERGLKGKTIGVAFDGTGYGTDGNLWGGEFLVADTEGFERVGHFSYVRLPGGETAIREPWRTAISYLLEAAGDEAIEYLKAIGFVERYGRVAVDTIMKVSGSKELSPLSSGAGRLFDAVSAVIGLCDRNTFEGEAAMALESLAAEGIDGEYSVDVRGDTIITVDFSQTMLGITNDMLNGEKKEVISTKFHNTLSSVILRVTERISETFGLRDVALSGGTFQNLYLLKKTTGLLNSRGWNVFLNEAVPCNDACISLGQAYLVRERLKRG